MREEAERLCTRALGYRTSDDIAEAQRREIAFARPTSLDQYLNRRCFRDAEGYLDARLDNMKTEFGQMLSSQSQWQTRDARGYRQFERTERVRFHCHRA